MRYATAPRRSSLVRLTLGLGALLPTTAAADIIIHDDFDDATLDPAWQVTLSNTTDWTYEESGTHLMVSDIAPEVVNQGSGGQWSVVQLTRAGSGLTDLHVDFTFSWDCQESNSAMQGLNLSLIDASNNLIVSAGTSDPWVRYRPCRFALIGDESVCQSHELPHDGSGSIDIDRTGDQVTVFWDGVPILTGFESAPIEIVRLTFSFYAYDGPPASLFGTESVDLVSVQGLPTGVALRSWSSIKAYFR